MWSVICVLWTYDLWRHESPFRTFHNFFHKVQSTLWSLEASLCAVVPSGKQYLTLEASHLSGTKQSPSKY